MIYHLYSSYVLNFNKTIKRNNLDLRVMRRKRIEVWKDNSIAVFKRKYCYLDLNGFRLGMIYKLSTE